MDNIEMNQDIKVFVKTLTERLNNAVKIIASGLSDIDKEKCFGCMNDYKDHDVCTRKTKDYYFKKAINIFIDHLDSNEHQILDDYLEYVASQSTQVSSQSPQV